MVEHKIFVLYNHRHCNENDIQYGPTIRYLVGHVYMAEMHAKWPMATPLYC